MPLRRSDFFRRISWRRHAQASAAVLALLCHVWAARGNDDQALAQRVKAAFLFNFVQFTDFPASVFADGKAPIVVGVFSTDGMEEVVARTVRGKTAHGRPLQVRNVVTAEDVEGCHVLYAAAGDAGVREALAKAAVGVLTVGESDAFAEAGGAIRFFGEDNKIRFEVNLNAVERAKLQLSSKLLKLARTVRR